MYTVITTALQSKWIFIFLSDKKKVYAEKGRNSRWDVSNG